METGMTANHLFALTGQVAIVTGAGRGIGRACALMLAQAGADVALAARTQKDIDAVAEQIRGLGRKAIAVAGDVHDEATRDPGVARSSTSPRWRRAMRRSTSAPTAQPRRR